MTVRRSSDARDQAGVRRRRARRNRAFVLVSAACACVGGVLWRPALAAAIGTAGGVVSALAIVLGKDS